MPLSLITGIYKEVFMGLLDGMLKGLADKFLGQNGELKK